MATSTLRAVIIVAAVVFGGVVLANAFPPASPVGPVGPIPTTSSPSPSTSTSPSPSAPRATIKNAHLQVLNGTSKAGLAATVAKTLRAAGAFIPDTPDYIGNASQNYAVTTLVFRPDSKALAQLLQQRFFPGAKLQKGQVNNLKPDVRVTVIVGADYAQSHT
jgi:hypothetical protein